MGNNTASLRFDAPPMRPAASRGGVCANKFARFAPKARKYYHKDARRPTYAARVR